MQKKDYKKSRVDTEKLIKNNPGERSLGLDKESVNGNDKMWVDLEYNLGWTKYSEWEIKHKDAEKSQELYLFIGIREWGKLW